MAEFCGLGGCAGHVKGAQGELLRHIVRNLGVDTALEEDGLALDVDLVHVGTDFQNLVDPQRGQREADERCDTVAFLEVDLALEGVADLFDLAQEHAARTGATVAVLSLQFHVEEHLFLDFLHDALLAGTFAGLLLRIVVDIGE